MSKEPGGPEFFEHFIQAAMSVISSPTHRFHREGQERMGDVWMVEIEVVSGFSFKTSILRVVAGGGEPPTFDKTVLIFSNICHDIETSHISDST